MPDDKNKHLHSDEDSELFRASVGEVNRLNVDKHHSFDDKAKPKPHPIKTAALREKRPSRPPQISNDILSDDPLLFTQNGLQHKLIKQLKRGSIRIDEKLDLHGLNAQAAEHLLSDFLDHAIEQHYRCVLIVHGKGTRSLNSHPVLKNLTFSVLKNATSILAFCSAQPCHGGTGALYVLLKKSNSNEI